MNRVIILAVFLLSTVNLSAQNIELIVNAESANQTFQFLKLKKNDTAGARKILSLKGTQGMIQHDSQFNEEMTSENFIKEITDPNAESDEFGFINIRRNLTSIQAAIQLFEDSLNVITRRVEEKLKLYSSPTNNEAIEVYFVLGGNSDGYTNDENAFFIEIQYYLDDVEGIISTVTHELYHIIQQRSFDSKTEKLKLQAIFYPAFMLIENLYQEGSASYVGDPLSIDQPKEYSIFIQKKYKRNILKLKESFYLFESLLLQSIADPNEDLLYNIGFGGQWDSPLYFVGYEMCLQLEQKNEEGTIKEYLSKSPTYFFMDYIDLYKSDPQIRYHFTAATEKTIEKVHAQMTK